MNTTTTTTTAVVAALALVRQTADERLDAARRASAEALALPKGTRGKAAKVKATRDEVFAAQEQVAVIRGAVREAHRPLVEALVERTLATLDHRDADPIVRQAMAARHHRLGVSAIRLNDDLVGQPYGVHCRLTRDAYGLPQYLELRMLATPDEHRKHVNRWLEKATTPEARADVQPYIDDPGANPIAQGGVSISVGRTWRSDSTTFSVNASTYQVETDEEATRLRLLIDVAFSLRFSLNAIEMPTPEALENMLEGNG